MLNPFPQLFLFSFFAPTILRIATSLFFFFLSYKHFRDREKAVDEMGPRKGSFALVAGLMLLQLVIGMLLFLGLWAQIAALIGLVLTLITLLLKKKWPMLAPLSLHTYILLSVVCLSLLLSGAGAVAFDVPL